MGYTHYWKSQDNVDDAAYTAALKDIAKIVKNKAKILAGPFGEKGTLPKTTGGIAFNGIEDDSHETFDLPASAGQLEDFSFCKTARKPYDIVVVAALTRLAEVPGISISSDGDATEWKNGISLAEKVLGRKLKNPMAPGAEEEKPAPKAKAKLKLVKSYLEKIQAHLDEDEDEDEHEPSEDDAFFSPCGPLGSKTHLSVNNKSIGEFKSDRDAQKALVDWINKNKFYPNIWYVSDHGNVHPHELDSDLAKQIKM